MRLLDALDGVSECGIGFVSRAALWRKWGLGSMAVVLSSGSASIIGAFHWQHGLSWRLLVPAEAIGPLVASGTAIGVSLFLHQVMGRGGVVEQLLFDIGGVVLILAPVLWFHPLRPFLFARAQGVGGKAW